MYAKDRSTIVDRREMLRVKLKSLAEEAKIIRREEHRTHGALRDELHTHRVLQVRSAARATHLAYGFIKGRTLAQMEPTRRPVPDYIESLLWADVRKMLKKYGPFGMLEPEVMKKAA
jgi:hypothetical protein